MRLEEFLSYIENASGYDNQYSALCPAHDDKKKSLSITTNQDGQILVHCHAGCTTNQIVESLELSAADLYPAYDYCDVNGRLLAQKIRYAGKKFAWRRPDGKGGWIKNRKGVPSLLYNLSSVKDRKTVYVVEGEKDVDTLCSHGLVAVCGADGAGPGKWKPDYTEQLAGKAVIILWDNDDVGRAFALETARALYGTAKKVRLVDLRDVWPNIPDRGDITDLIECLGVEGLVKVRRLVKETEDFEPSRYADSNEQGNSSLVSLDEVEDTPPEYFWEPYIRLHNINIIRGDGGTGKTMFVMALMAAVSMGKQPAEMPGTLRCEQSAVIYYGAEDDPGEYAHRAKLCGSNGRDIHVMGDVKEYPSLSELDTIRSHIIEKKARLVVFDPLQSFLGKDVDMHRANEVRPLLDGLRSMCRKLECTAVIIEHLNKSTQQKAHYRGIGTVDVINASRSALMVGWHPSKPNMRAAVHIKANAKYGESIMFHIDEDGRFIWKGVCDVSADELADATQKQAEEGNSIHPVFQIVKDIMGKYPDGWSGTAEEMLDALGRKGGDISAKSIGRSLPGLQHALYQKGIVWERMNRTHWFSKREIRL